MEEIKRKDSRTEFNPTPGQKPTVVDVSQEELEEFYKNNKADVEVFLNNPAFKRLMEFIIQSEYVSTEALVSGVRNIESEESSNLYRGRIQCFREVREQIKRLKSIHEKQ